MDQETAMKRSRQVGIGSAAIGAALLLWPERLGRLADLDGREARLVALGDLAVVPGLVWGRPRWPWTVARGGVNLAIVGLLIRHRSPRARIGAAALGALTVADLQVAAALTAGTAPSAYGRFSAATSETLNRRGIYLGRRSTRVHVALYRRTGGRVGGHLPGWPGARVALVDHRGARSGTARTSPLMYHEDGETIAVVASRAGQQTNPAWLHNLLANPETTVQIGAELRPVRARLAGEEECERLWPEFLAFYPGYAAFRERARPRVIPIVLLEPRRAHRRCRSRV
jgi:deazaflavin-dependent oxidoreductase (nitroreductase family)